MSYLNFFPIWEYTCLKNKYVQIEAIAESHTFIVFEVSETK